MKPMPKTHRLDWHAIKDRVDLAAVATGLLGPSPKRSGRRLLWHCPFHDDRNPSFEVDPARGRWKCWPCNKGGDAAALVMQLRGVGFPEAVRTLADRAGIVVPSGWPRRDGRPAGAKAGAKAFPTTGATDPRPHGRPGPVARADRSPAGLAADDARSLVEESAGRLWTPEGRPAREYLVRHRGLAEATIRRHRLGWTPGVTLPASDGIRFFRVGGIVIPWLDEGGLRAIKIRRLDGREPKYVQAFEDGARVYPGPSAIRPGATLIVVEGEFDAILLGQELGEIASVATFGGSSIRPGVEGLLAVILSAGRIAAHDADRAGDAAAAAYWPTAERARPPVGKDWTDARNAGIDLRLWWIDRHFPAEFDREERAAIMEFDGGTDGEIP